MNNKILEKSLFYKENNIRLYNSNCLDILKNILEESIDMIFADPPYFLSNGSFSCQNGIMAPVKKGNWDMGKSIEENFNFI